MLQSWSLGCGNGFSFYIEMNLNILFKKWNNQEAQRLTSECEKKMKTFQNKIYTLLTCPKLSRYFYFETAEIFILSYMEIVNQLSLVTPWPLVVYCIAESFEQNTRSLIKEYISCKYIQKVKIFFKNWKTNLTTAQCSSCFNQT